MIETFHITHGLTKKERKLHQKFSEYGMIAREWTRKCALLLPEIDRHRIWRKKGFGSIYEYAAKIAGMSRWSVDDALRISRKIEDKPALKKVAEEKGLNAVRRVATIATAETAKFWAVKAQTMSQPALNQYIIERKHQDVQAEGEPEIKAQVDTNKKSQDNSNFGINPKQARSTAEDSPPSKSKKATLEELLSPHILKKLQKLKGQGSWDELMEELLAAREEKLQREKPEPVKTESRYIPARIKTYVIKRTNGSCAYPRCTKPYTILHHTQRFALEKVHDPDRLVPLCTAHERLAHQGLIKNEEQPSMNWRVTAQPDRSNPKYSVDRLVQQFRAPP